MSSHASNPIVQVDTLIVGAGVIGSSLAMHLARLSGEGAASESGIRVIDFDLEGMLSSSELNAGGVRATMTQPANIRMSQLTIDYFATVAERVGYRPVGYLWLHTDASVANALAARKRQVEMGWEVQEWSTAELRARVPFIDKTDDLAGALFAPRDGLVNPNTVKTHYRDEARMRGVQFDDRTLLRKAEFSASGVRLTAERYSPLMSTEGKIDALCQQEAQGRQGAGETVVYEAKRVVNCAGPWAGVVARVLGYPCPSYPLRRQISIFDCRDADLTQYGMIVDTSGVYFHPEATNGLAGLATTGEPHEMNYRYDGEDFFMEQIWPALYERSSAFERLKHLTGWAGLYEVSPDEGAIIGEVAGGDQAGKRRVYEAHSFSGHGVMHSYAAGLSLAELMVRGRYETMDASPFSARRFDSGELIHEGLVI